MIHRAIGPTGVGHRMDPWYTGCRCRQDVGSEVGEDDAGRTGKAMSKPWMTMTELEGLVGSCPAKRGAARCRTGGHDGSQHIRGLRERGADGGTVVLRNPFTRRSAGPILVVAVPPPSSRQYSGCSHAGQSRTRGQRIRGHRLRGRGSVTTASRWSSSSESSLVPRGQASTATVGRGGRG